ncbi:MBL fold metallo-hydrolase [bacterium]|nr:MAG: MBL fold metallo-hydrolase [bacterium]
MKITHLKHASFLIQGKKNIYIDPYKLKGDLPLADIILITHSHFDHCSPDDIAKIRDNNTNIIATRDCSIQSPFTTINQGEKIDVDDVKITAVPAYNVNKDFHPKSKNWVGYIVEAEGIKIYHSGDTDVIEEMENFNVDIALLPVGGTYTMDVEQALEAVKKLSPRMVIPMHFGEVVGSMNDALNFCRKCAVECKVLNPYEEWEVNI